MTEPRCNSRLVLIALAVWAATTGATDAVERRVEGALVYEDVPPAPPVLATRLAPYLQDRDVDLMSWTAAGGLIIRRRAAETRQAFLISAPGAEPVAITAGEQSVTAVYASPVSEDMLLLIDADGGESYRLYHRDPEGGLHPLTPAGTRSQDVIWSPDGSRFAFSSNLDDGSNTDVYIGDLSGPDSIQLVLKGGGAWFPVDWHPNGEELLIQEYISVTESRLYRSEIGSDEAVLINLLVPGPLPIADADYDEDGEGIFISTMLGPGRHTLYHFDLRRHIYTTMAPRSSGDVLAQTLSTDGRYLAYLAIKDGISRIYALDLWRERRLPNLMLPSGQIEAFGFSQEGAQLAVAVSSANQPSEVWVADLARYEARRWLSQSPVSVSAPPELVRYPTFDSVASGSRRIPAFVYRPQGPGPYPVVVYLHGGPESQFIPGYDGFFRFLVDELGVAIVAPNVRGSSGYGQRYLGLDDGILREDAVRDVGALLDWMETEPDLDASRVIVWGGSYGGYMVLASLMNYSDRLLGGVDVVGISNFVTFLENTSEYRRDLRRQEYGDERDPEIRRYLEAIAPANHAERITRPVLVVQGANDPRVPRSEAEQMVAQIRANGGEVWYLLAMDEGHGFERRSNRDAYHLTVAQFIQTLIARANAPGP
jgi:dipeptidyl aminopeptidase/acylaminoacyl peptidase